MEERLIQFGGQLRLPRAVRKSQEEESAEELAQTECGSRLPKVDVVSLETTQNFSRLSSDTPKDVWNVFF